MKDVKTHSRLYFSSSSYDNFYRLQQLKQQPLS